MKKEKTTKEEIEKKMKYADYWQCSPSDLIKVGVDCYIPSLGGFMDRIDIYIPPLLAMSLRGRYDEETDEWIRNADYWNAVRQIKYLIAELTGIPFWKEHWTERTLEGNPNAPISIISIKKL